MEMGKWESGEAASLSAGGTRCTLSLLVVSSPRPAAEHYLLHRNRATRHFQAKYRGQQ